MHRERHARLVDAMQRPGRRRAVAARPAERGYATGVRAPPPTRRRAHAPPAGRARHRRRRRRRRCGPGIPTACPPTVRATTSTAGLDLEWDDEPPRLAESERSSARGGSPSTSSRCRCGRPCADRSRRSTRAGVLGAAKIAKTADEIECIRRAQAINEAAIVDVEPMLDARPEGDRPDRHASSGRLFELGAISSNTVDPIWQVMPPSIADGPFSATATWSSRPDQTRSCSDEGDVDLGRHRPRLRGLPVRLRPHVGRRRGGRRTRARALRDAGATWSTRRRRRVAPGATARDLTGRVAGGGRAGRRRPWLPHFYLAHGTGHRERRAAVRRDRPRRGVRRELRARARDGPRVRAGDLGRR